MTRFSENTEDEGRGRITCKLKPDHIDDRRFQGVKAKYRASRGGRVNPTKGLGHDTDHIDMPANKKLFPAGGEIGKRKGFGPTRTKGRVMPSPRRYLQGAPRSEYE
jgi:hypothetical protein